MRQTTSPILIQIVLEEFFSQKAFLKTPINTFWSIHKSNEALNQIIQITKASFFATIPTDGQMISLQNLNNEVTDNSVLIWIDTRTIGVKKFCYTNFQLALTTIIEEKCFCTSLRLTVTRRGPMGLTLPQQESAWG